MSHNSTLKSKLKTASKSFILEALKKLYPKADIRENGHFSGYRGAQTKADIAIGNACRGYGFGMNAQKDGTYELVGDWGFGLNTSAEAVANSILTEANLAESVAVMTEQGFVQESLALNPTKQEAYEVVFSRWT